MTIEEYKELSKNIRCKTFKFPSGLELYLELPSAKEFLDIVMNTPEQDVYKVILEIIAKKFPENLTLEELLPEDLMYLMEEVKGFFMSKYPTNSNLS